MQSTLRQLLRAAGPAWALGLASGVLAVRSEGWLQLGVLALGAVATGWWVWRELSRPQRRLAHAARLLQRGLPAEEPPLDSGVLGELARDLQSLTQTVENERRFFEQRVRQHTSELREESLRKDDFLANTAHELRTPLTTVQASLDILAEFEDLEAADAAEFLGQARVACGHMLFLLNDLVDQAAIAAGRLSIELDRHHVLDLVEDIETLIRPLVAARGMTLEVTVPDDDPEVLADRGRTMQVLFNLLGNAVKYSEGLGHPVELVVTTHAEVVHFAIRDRGIGVPDTRRDRLFTRFGRAHADGSNAPSGTGIGLHLCAVLVERMGGRIGYLPRGDAEGSEFWFELRNAASPTAMLAAAPELLEGEAGSPGAESAS